MCLTRILWWLNSLVDFKLSEELYLSVARSWHSYLPSASGKTATLNEKQRPFRKQLNAQYKASCTLLIAIGDTSRNVRGCFTKLACLCSGPRYKLSCCWAATLMTRITRQATKTSEKTKPVMARGNWSHRQTRFSLKRSFASPQRYYLQLPWRCKSSYALVILVLIKDFSSFCFNFRTRISRMVN